MSTPISRSSLDISQHKAVDLELKNLKILNRRLQESLNCLSNELQILQRLIYKNKNQHRGALFWRNVIEIRRYSEKIEKQNLYQLMHTFRCSFYDSSTPNALKGPWLFCPDKQRTKSTLNSCKASLMLATKACDITLAAYRAFHRSMQSGAFVQLLLTFIAIASRIRMLCLELKEVNVQHTACLHRVLEVIDHAKDGLSHSVQKDGHSKEGHLLQVKDAPTSFASSSCDTAHMSEPDLSVLNVVTQGTSSQNLLSGSVARPGYTNSVQVKHVGQRDAEKRGGNDTLPEKKKKKRRVPKNEIDDIFGF